MAFRKRTSRRKSKRIFKRGTRVNKRNRTRRVPRGGIRL